MAAIDTTSPAGKLVFSIFAALAEFERELISDWIPLRSRWMAPRLPLDYKFGE
jgi:DNA invertase Pin-like site-specific DNA recombinase